MVLHILIKNVFDLMVMDLPQWLWFYINIYLLMQFYIYIVVFNIYKIFKVTSKRKDLENCLFFYLILIKYGRQL